MFTRKAAIEDLRKAKRGQNKIDKAEMEFLAKIIGRSQYKKALGYYSSMDTYVREGIPREVVHFLQVKADGGVRTVVAHIRLKDCEKVFREGFKPGVVVKFDLDFPKGITDEQMAMALVGQNDEVLAKAVEVLYTEGDEDLVVIDTSRGF